MKTRYAAVLTIFASASVFGADLTTQVGDIVVSSNTHNWFSDFTLPDGLPGTGGVFDLDGDIAITNIINTDTDFGTYGVDGETLFTTNVSFGDSAPTVELDGPILPGDRFMIHGWANEFASDYSGELFAGTGAFAPQPVFMPWTLLITPGAGESNGDPILVSVSATVAGSIGANGVSSSALASWRIDAGPHTLLDTTTSASKGGDIFNETNTLTFLTTIGSTFDLEALYRLQIFGDSDITGADSFGRFTETSVRVTLLDPACAADINGDGVVDTADLGILLGLFGSNNPIADINGDGVVDTADLGILLAGFGTTCN